MKVSNLEEIKKIAILMVDVEPVINKKFTFISIHPYFNSTTLPLFENGIPVKMFNWNEDEESFIKYKDMLKEEISKAKDIYSIILMMNKSYYMNFVRLTYMYMSDTDLAKVLRTVWVTQEFPNWNDKGKELSVDKKLFRKVSGIIMNEDELKYYNSLPDIVTIYRGHFGKYYNALSWTANIKVAVKFSNRFAESTLLKAKINKKDIIAYLAERDEDELIVDYNKLYDIEEVSID